MRMVRLLNPDRNVCGALEENVNRAAPGGAAIDVLQRAAKLLIAGLLLRPIIDFNEARSISYVPLYFGTF